MSLHGQFPAQDFARSLTPGASPRLSDDPLHLHTVGRWPLPPGTLPPGHDAGASQEEAEQVCITVHSSCSHPLLLLPTMKWWRGPSCSAPLSRGRFGVEGDVPTSRAARDSGLGGCPALGCVGFRGPGCTSSAPPGLFLQDTELLEPLEIPKRQEHEEPLLFS